MNTIIVWDSLAQFSDLPGHWILPVGVALLWVLAAFGIFNEVRRGAVILWNERQERKADRINAALRRAQDANERSLRLVGGNWRRG